MAINIRVPGCKLSVHTIYLAAWYRSSCAACLLRPVLSASQSVLPSLGIRSDSDSDSDSDAPSPSPLLAASCAFSHKTSACASTAICARLIKTYMHEIYRACSLVKMYNTVDAEPKKCTTQQ